MGLLPWHEHSSRQMVIDLALNIAERYLDMDSLLNIAEEHSEINIPEALLYNEPTTVNPEYGSIKVGIVKDSAFQFYYEENLEELRNLGAELVEVNALSDRGLPPVDCLYIGGGFPETNAVGLSENREFIESLRRAIEEGLPVYAECGGMMYLGREIIFKERRYPMAGVIPVSFYMEERPVSHGYTVVEVTEENPFYPVGTVLRGHEFHYSRPVNIGELRLSFTMKRGDGIINKKDGVSYKNLLATYTHVHAYGTKEWAEGLIKKGATWRKRHA
jgi:cobyrinic acid a,c-diamide synthase